MTTARIARPTDIVFHATQEIDPVAEAERAATEVDWSYDDAELTMQLRAVHVGRGWLVAALATSLLVIALGIALVV